MKYHDHSWSRWAPEESTKLQALHNMDTLLHIFKHLPLKDCFTCRLVNRSWLQAVDKHFCTLPRLTISYKDVTQMSDENLSRSNRELWNTKLYTIEVHHIQNYHKFAHTLSLFPSVQHFSMSNHPLNDIFLSLLVVFLPRLSQLNLQSCWMHPSMLQERLNRSNHSVNPLWTILNRIYCPKYLQENDSSLDYLLDTIRQFCNNESLCIQLCSYLQGVTQQSTAERSHDNANEISLDLGTQAQLSKTGYRLLVQSYNKMSCLTLSNCGLTEETAGIVLKQLREIKHLNIVDNENIEGHCLRYLSPTCESLIAGSFNLQVSILDLLCGIVHSHASNLKHLELTGYISASLHHLEQLTRLECLVLHFYCDRVGPHFVPFYSITRLTNLRTLVLQQEYCYEEKSALEHDLLCAITRHCDQLERLEVLGEYGWKLKLDDQSLLVLASNAANLRHLALTGNSLQITDKGIEWLAKLTRLETLTLTSFDAITDKSISEIVMQLKHLNNLCLRDNCQLTIKTLEACVVAAYANPDRTLNVHVDEKQMSASKLFMKHASSYIRDTWHHKIHPLVSELHEQVNEHTGKSLVYLKESLQDRKCYQRWPTNLNVVIDENLRSYKYDAEDLTLVKLITIFCASILIIVMMITTLAVVIFLPAGMAIYLLYEKIFTNVLLQPNE